MELAFVKEYRSFRYRNYERFARWADAHGVLVNVGYAVGMALVTAALAQIILPNPLSPVPYTGQVLGIALTGGLLGRKWGTISASLYILMGLVGLPVFAGQVAEFDGFRLMSGMAALTGVTGGFLVGFVVQAFIIGWIADRRTHRTQTGFVGTAAATGLALALFILLDAYALSQAQHTQYYTSGLQALFLALLVAGEVAVIGALAWLALTSKARRERIELFMANILGLVALYVIGATVFFIVYQSVVGPIGLMGALRGAVLPFIPADLTKILLAIAVLTLFRPTHAEIAVRRQGAAAENV